MKTIGVSCFYHDSAVTAIENGKILFAIQEERLSRLKHDARFPQLALQAALLHCDWRWGDVDLVCFHENPDLKFDRIVAQARTGWPTTWNYWHNTLPYHHHHKCGVETHMRVLGYEGPVVNDQHHKSHAAATFFTSPFDQALVLVMDGVGEWDTTTLWKGVGNTLTRVQSISFPHSLGLFYSAMTNYLGFRANNGEFKVMGLAAMGSPTPLRAELLHNVLLLHDDGSFELNQKYFDWCNPCCHHTPALERLLRNVEPRRPGDPIEHRHMDLAAAVQSVLEQAILQMVRRFLEQSNCYNLCLAGGVALNCVANSRILRHNPRVNLWIMPAAGDAGCAMGAAILGDLTDCPSTKVRRYHPFNPYLGSIYPAHIVEMAVKGWGFKRQPTSAQIIAQKLVQGKIVTLYQGRDEWGNRALGNRTILADPRDAGMKDHINTQVKFREPFRPFAPVVMNSHAGRWFELLGASSSYMMLTHKAYKPDQVPAVVHTNGMSRIQTVDMIENGFLFEIIREFFFLTGVPVLLNTSFNLRGEPIVSSPYDAMRTFEQSGIDVLAFGRWFMLEK